MTSLRSYPKTHGAGTSAQASGWPSYALSPVPAGLLHYKEGKMLMGTNSLSSPVLNSLGGEQHPFPELLEHKRQNRFKR